MRRIPIFLCRIFLPALLILLALPAFIMTPERAAAQASGPIYQVTIDSVLSRYAADYIRRAVREAEAAEATALIIQLSNDGAVLRVARDLAIDLAAAQVPVIVYVGPSGTAAGAAGSWLLSAADLAVLAPDTSFGAATPLATPSGDVSPATLALFEAEVERQLSEWNRERGRSDAWIGRAVREGAILTNEQAIALDPPAIDLVARDQADLLLGLEGRVVTLADGSTRTLDTLGRSARPLEPSLIESLLLLLASPTTAFLLLVMAGIAIYAEFITPTIGALAAIGVILLITSLVGLLVLPVNWISVLVLFFAFGFIAADLFVPSHGALTVVGVVALIGSALTLIDNAQAPGVSVAIWAVLLVAVGVAGFAAAGIWMMLRTRQRPVSTGQEGLIGRMAEVRRRLDPDGMVFVEGALWRAISEDGVIEQGEWVRITAVYELRLTVKRLSDEGAAEAS